MPSGNSVRIGVSSEELLVSLDIFTEVDISQEVLVFMRVYVSPTGVFMFVLEGPASRVLVQL